MDDEKSGDYLVVLNTSSGQPYCFSKFGPLDGRLTCGAAPCWLASSDLAFPNEFSSTSPILHTSPLFLIILRHSLRRERRDGPTKVLTDANSRRRQCEGHGPSSVNMRWITLGDNIA
eukprot:361578-Chlamydomonas_euryale.AAC.2